MNDTNCNTHQSSRKDQSILPEIEAALELGLLGPEEAADAILEAEGALGRAHGTYSATQLSRRMRLEREHLPVLDVGAVPEELCDALVARRADELVSLAALRPMEEVCLRLCVDGLSAKQSAMLLGIGRRRVEMHLRIAKRKARAAYSDGPYAGWYEVYLSEIRRGRKG